MFYLLYLEYYSTSILPCQRQIEELPNHYVKSKKWLELKNMLVAPTTFNMFWTNVGGLNRADLITFWCSIVKTNDNNKKKKKKKNNVKRLNSKNVSDGYRLFHVFDIVEEYIESIEHWSKNQSQSR